CRRCGPPHARLPDARYGSVNPPLEALGSRRLALRGQQRGLTAPPRRDIHLIRAGEGVVMHAERDPYEAAMLASCPPGARRDIYRVTAKPGTAHLARPHTLGTVEHLILGTGRVLAGPDGEAVELGPGDYIRYPGDVPHVFEALSPDTAGIIVMEHV